MCSDYLILRIFIPFAKIESTNVQATVFNRIYEMRMAKISKDTRNESLLPLFIQSYEKTIQKNPQIQIFDSSRSKFLHKKFQASCQRSSKRRRELH